MLLEWAFLLILWLFSVFCYFELFLVRYFKNYNVRSFLFTAKLSEGKSYSIVSDYLGRPAQAYDDKGKLVWQVEFDTYGRIREDSFNNKQFIPFRQLGQYKDVETGLYYNRFRYYNPETGLYISQDPIKLVETTRIFMLMFMIAIRWSIRSGWIVIGVEFKLKVMV
ncbi:RHS repeat domain-containing protein [Apibacter mensalis]|uniref:RHS repeat domain-containing protein n=1 Tax=Apibacter mensalis TaxID=1586267 RepID=UPI0026F0BC13|nr:RHS repeat-associated core domain-containing protein [Apibacter mensalis]